MYLGVPVHSKSSLFGDSKSVVTSATIPTSIMAKWHHIASFHHVQEAIAAKLLIFHWKDGKTNPADILSKHWGISTVWPLHKPVLFWHGDSTLSKSQERGVIKFTSKIPLLIHMVWVAIGSQLPLHTGPSSGGPQAAFETPNGTKTELVLYLDHFLVYTQFSIHLLYWYHK